MQQDLKVSVCMITYGHEKYIREAIEGVLMQECDFEVELILANDCSPDSTDKIIQDILKNHSRRSRIKYFNHKENLGMMPNFIDALKKCDGKYVALCEGDDYWTDPFKLQKQVDFLENNHECNICFHRANLLLSNSFLLHNIPTSYDVIPFNYIQLLENYNFITTASVLFRNPETFILPQWFESLPFGDLGLYKIVSDNKKIACINEIMSVYRIHDNGVFSRLNQIESETKYLIFYKNIYEHLNDLEKKVVSHKIKEKLLRISQINFKNKILSTLNYYFNLIKYYKYS